MKQIIYTFFIVFLASGFSIPQKMEKKIDKEISNAFSLQSFQKEILPIENTIQEELPVSFQEDNFQKIVVDNHVIGYFYFGKAPSKTDTFDFVVIFDTDLIIKKIKILAYREDYGGEIGSTRWLRQFNDLGKNDSVAYGKEIKGISGATISASSMTLAVNDLLQSLAILKNKNIL
jgi:hypothetical protein